MANKYNYSGEYSCSRCHDDSRTDKFFRCKQCNKELKDARDALVSNGEQNG